MIKLRAFLALEESLTLRLSSTATALMESTLKAIDAALENEDFDTAESLVQEFDLTQVFDMNQGYIDYVSKLAMIFGASRVTRKPGTSAVALGFDSEAREASIGALRKMILGPLTEYMKTTALQLIALRKPAPATTQDQLFKEEQEGKYLGKALKAAKAKALLPFESFMNQEGQAVFRLASSLHTSRLSGFGFTAEAKYLGYTEYKVNEQLDGRTCPVCRLMHGKVFKVQDARNLLDTVVRTQNPDVLKSLQPWPKQTKANLEAMGTMTPEEFVARGWHVPPYHPYCRGLLAKTTQAIPLPQEGSLFDEPPEEPTPATKEDFLQVGINLSSQKVEQWNALVKQPPSVVIAKLSGKEPVSLLDSLQGVGDPQTDLGLANLSVTSTGVTVELQTPLKGAQHPVVQEYIFRKSKSLFVGSIKLHETDAHLFKTVLRNLYSVAENTSMDNISVVTGESMGGFAFAKYGFSLKPTAWTNLKRAIRAKLVKEPVQLTALQEKALKAVLSSPDPKSIWALADMPVLGKSLLSDLQWNAYLDLNDQEAMTRFLTYIG